MLTSHILRSGSCKSSYPALYEGIAHSQEEFNHGIQGRRAQHLSLLCLFRKLWRAMKSVLSLLFSSHTNTEYWTGYTVFDASQDGICLLGCQDTLLTHAEPAAVQPRQITFCRAAFPPLLSRFILFLALLQSRKHSLEQWDLNPYPQRVWSLYWAS